MNFKIEDFTKAIKAMESTETRFLVTQDVYAILRKYGVSGKPIGIFGYMKIDKPPKENLEDILKELKKILIEETLKECTEAMSVEEVEELMDHLESVVNV